MAALNGFAIVGGTLASFLLGWIWYGPLFGKRWMRERGIDPAAAQANGGGMGKLLAINLVLTLVAAIVMAHVLATYGHPSVDISAMIGGGIGFGFVATSLGTAYAYTKQSFTLWCIDGGYWTIGFTAMAIAESLLS